MTDLEKDLEKVLKGLAACLPETDEDEEIGCAGCPYAFCLSEKTVAVGVRLVEDARRLLRDRAPRVMSWDEARLHAMQYMDPDAIRPVFVEHRSPDRGQLIWAGGYAQRMMLTLQDEYGVKFRFWSDRPTEQQREAQMWDS